MAVVSNPFGGVALSGEDARKFRRQVSFGRTNAAARAAASRGSAAAKLLLAQGQVKVDSLKG